MLVSAAAAAAAAAFYGPSTHAGIAAPHAGVAVVPLRTRAIRCCDMPSDSYDDTEDIASAAEVPSASEPPEKSALFALLDGIDRGFAASSSQRKAVTSALEALKAVNPRPTDGAIGLSGDWELLYTDAPDILGLKNAGPLAELRRVGQQIDAEAGTIENVIEYAPASWLPLDAISASEDRVQQRVCLTYEVEKGTRCVCQVNTFGVNPQTFFGVNLRSSPPLKLPEAPFKVPFGNFDVLYNDGDIRVVRTIQGYYGVNRRITAEEEMWG